MIPLLCEKTGAVVLVQSSLTAGKQAGRHMKFAKFRDFKIMYWIYWMKHWNLVAFGKAQCHYCGTNAF